MKILWHITPRRNHWNLKTSAQTNVWQLSFQLIQFTIVLYLDASTDAKTRPPHLIVAARTSRSAPRVRGQLGLYLRVAVELVDLFRGDTTPVGPERFPGSVRLVGLARLGALLAVAERTALELFARRDRSRRRVEPRVTQSFGRGHALLRVDHEKMVDEVLCRSRHALPMLVKANSRHGKDQKQNNS